MTVLRRLPVLPSIRRAFLALAGAALLASCGGGASQVEPFVPARVIVFGDEMSLVGTDADPTKNGFKYTVNALKTAPDTGFDCSANPVWTQVVAGGYGFGFDSCPVGTGTQKGVMRAQAGATAATLQAQVDAQVGDASAVTGGLNERDLVTVMVGIRDVKDLFAQGGDEAARLAVARARGESIAEVVNGIVARGARVLVATVPEMGASPAGRAASGDLLDRLSRELNAGLRTRITADGRKWAVVVTHDFVKAAGDAPSSFNLSDVTTAACDAAKAAQLQDCTTDTLVAGATAAGWLWADDTWFAPGGHRELGARALSRARDNPF